MVTRRRRGLGHAADARRRRAGVGGCGCSKSHLAWVGTRTERAGQTVAFFGDLLRARLALQLDDFWVLKLSDGNKVESSGRTARSIGTSRPGWRWVLVDDVFVTTDALRSWGVELLLEPELMTAATPGSTSELWTATSTNSPKTRSRSAAVAVPKRRRSRTPARFPPERLIGAARK